MVVSAIDLRSPTVSKTIELQPRGPHYSATSKTIALMRQTPSRGGGLDLQSHMPFHQILRECCLATDLAATVPNAPTIRQRHMAQRQCSVGSLGNDRLAETESGCRVILGDSRQRRFRIWVLLIRIFAGCSLDGRGRCFNRGPTTSDRQPNRQTESHRSKHMMSNSPGRMKASGPWF